MCEEFWRVDPGLGSVLISAAFGADMIELFGSEEQKERSSSYHKGRVYHGIGYYGAGCGE